MNQIIHVIGIGIITVLLVFIGQKKYQQHTLQQLPLEEIFGACQSTIRSHSNKIALEIEETSFSYTSPLSLGVYQKTHFLQEKTDSLVRQLDTLLVTALPEQLSEMRGIVQRLSDSDREVCAILNETYPHKLNSYSPHAKAVSGLTLTLWECLANNYLMSRVSWTGCGKFNFSLALLSNPVRPKCGETVEIKFLLEDLRRVDMTEKRILVNNEPISMYDDNECGKLNIRRTQPWQPLHVVIESKRRSEQAYRKESEYTYYWR